jgi:SAM-dependent methyltransferase
LDVEISSLIDGDPDQEVCAGMIPPTGTSIRPREGEWWLLQQHILDRWIRRSPTSDLEGRLLKTDLFDEASGPHHHLHSLGTDAQPIGIDWDLGVARTAQARLTQAGIPAQLVVCDVRAMPFAASSLSAALSLSTLDHFPSTQSIVDSLRELARVVRAGGILMLTLDNPANPEVLLRPRLPSILVRYLRADAFPLGRTLNPRQAERVFRELQLEVVSRDYLLHAPRFIGIRVLKWLESREQQATAQWFSRMLGVFEVLSKSPLRSVTGHYIGWWLRNVRSLNEQTRMWREGRSVSSSQESSVD